MNFEHEFLKKLLMSNVYLKDMPLAGHLYRVTMQKVPEIVRKKKQGKSEKIMFFLSKSDNIEKKNAELSPWSSPQLNR